MIKLLFLDVGETLLHGRTPFPHALLALESLTRLTTASGDDLFVSLISDYHMPRVPGDQQEIEALEGEFLEILAEARMDRFFEPFEKHVTISSRAGVTKPARQIFELGVKRSGTGASLNECLFVTEDSEHLAKAQDFGMTVVRFGSGPGIEPSFSDWSDGVGLLADLIEPNHPANREAAAAAFLGARHELLNFRGLRQLDTDADTYEGEANRLVKLSDPRLGSLDGLYVELPCQVRFRCGNDGKIRDVTAGDPSQEEISDAVNFVAGLLKSKRVALPSEQTFGATHQVESDEAGRKRLLRRGYSAR